MTLIADPQAMPTAGQPATLPTLATDITDTTGHYTLNLPADFTGAGYADPNTGLVTFDVLVNGGGVNTLTTIETTITPATSTRTASPNTLTRTSFAGAGANTATTDPDSQLAAVFTDTTPAPDPVVSYPEIPYDGSAAPVSSNVVQLVKSYGGRWTAVGAWFSNVTGVRAHFDYSNGASSALGVGVSATGTYGSFSAESTHSESTTATQGFPTQKGQRSILERTLFTYKEYSYRQCFKECGPVTYKAVSTAWRGGSDVQQTGSPKAFTRCIKEQAGSGWRRTNTKSITWTNGVSIASAIGIDLSSQTGYTNEATQDIHFTLTRSLCGRNDYPGGTPYLLMARVYRQ